MDAFSVGYRAGVAARRQAEADRLVTEDPLFIALCQNFGVLACAAIHLGVTLASLVQRVARSKRLRTWRDAGRDFLVQKASERLQAAVSAGEGWALQFCARAGVKTAVPADAGKPVALVPVVSHRVAQPVAQGEPRPDLAEELNRRLVVALERGEPWAVMYCLSHLDPEGPYFAKCRRGWQHDLWAEQLAAAPTVTESAAEVGDNNGQMRPVEGAVVVPEENGDEPRMLVDADEGAGGAPPVCGELEHTSMASLAPPVTRTTSETAPPVCARQSERRSRPLAGEAGVGCSDFKIGGPVDGLDRLNIARILKVERSTPVAAAPPLSARGLGFSPHASAQAEATRSACLAPPVGGGGRRSAQARSPPRRTRWGRGGAIHCVVSPLAPREAAIVVRQRPPHHPPMAVDWHRSFPSVVLRSKRQH